MDFNGFNTTGGLSQGQLDILSAIGVNSAGAVEIAELVVTGNKTELKSIQLEITDPLIIVGDEQSADLAFAGISVASDADTKYHGLIRDPTSKEWNLTKDGSTPQDIGTLAALNLGIVRTNHITPSAGGLFLNNGGSTSTVLITNSIEVQPQTATNMYNATNITNGSFNLVNSTTNITTADIAENTNLYHTDARVSANADVVANLSHAGTAVLHRTINDSSASTTSLFSAHKITALANTKADTVHTHPISDIVNLTGSLAAKANLAHTHSIANVASLSATLLSLQSRAEKGVAGGYCGLEIGTGLVPSINLPATTNLVQSVNGLVGVVALTKANVGLTNVADLKTNHANVPPGVGNDSSQGYAKGSIWYDNAGLNTYTCVSDGVGSANWKTITGAPHVSIAMNDLTNVSGALAQNSFPLYDGVSEFKMTNILTTIQGDSAVSANSTHRGDNTVHFTEASIDHTNIANRGTNSHTQIDNHMGLAQTHLSDASIHFTKAQISHNDITDTGTNTHAQIDTHIADGTKHRIINDAGTTNTELFSSAKIISELNLKSTQVAMTAVEARLPDDNFALTKVQDIVSLPSTQEPRSIAFNGSQIYVGGSLDATYGTTPMIRRFDFNVLDVGTGAPLIEDINLNTLSGKICTSVESLKVFGNWLFAINPEAGAFNNTTGMGCHVFDISNAGLSYNTGMSDALTGLGASFWDAEVVGKFLYIKIGSNLRTYSLVNPIPVLINTLATGANFRQLYSDGQYLYNFFVPDGCRIFNIQNGIPVLVGDLVIPSNTIKRVLGVLRDGNKLYVTQTDSFSSDNRLWILDVSSSITSPTLFCTHAYGDNTIPRKLSLCGTSIFVSKIGTVDTGFHILDAVVTQTNYDDDELTEKLNHTGDGAIFQVEMFGDRIYAMNYSSATLHEFKHTASLSYAGAKICSVVSEKTSTGVLNAAKINCTTTGVFGGGILAGGDSLIDGDLLLDGDLTTDDIFGKSGQEISIRNFLNNARIELNATGSKITLYSDSVVCKDNMTVNGDLTVSGTTTTINTTEIDIADPMIKLANGNVTNAINSGFYSTYNNGQTRFDGLLRYFADGDHYLLANLTTEPTNTTNLSGLTRGNLNVADLDAGGSLTVGGLGQDTSATCFGNISKDHTVGAVYAIAAVGVVGNMIARYQKGCTLTASSIQISIVGTYEVKYELALAPGASSLLTKAVIRRNGVAIAGTEGFFKNVTGVVASNTRSVITNCNVNDVFDLYLEAVPSTQTMFSSGLTVRRLLIQ
jgi:hypothetical protein